MNESKKMKKVLPYLLMKFEKINHYFGGIGFITGITKSSQFLNVGNVQSIGKQLTEYALCHLEWVYVC